MSASPTHDFPDACTSEKETLCEIEQSAENTNTQIVEKSKVRKRVTKEKGKDKQQNGTNTLATDSVTNNTVLVGDTTKTKRRRKSEKENENNSPTPTPPTNASPSAVDDPHKQHNQDKKSNGVEIQPLRIEKLKKAGGKQQKKDSLEAKTKTVIIISSAYKGKRPRAKTNESDTNIEKVEKEESGANLVPRLNIDDNSPSNTASSSASDTRREKGGQPSSKYNDGESKMTNVQKAKKSAGAITITLQELCGSEPGPKKTQKNMSILKRKDISAGVKKVDASSKVQGKDPTSNESTEQSIKVNGDDILDSKERKQKEESISNILKKKAASKPRKVDTPSSSDDDSDEDFDEEDDESYYDEEEEYIKSIGEDKAADLFELQERLYELGPGKVPLRFQILQSTHPDLVKARLLKMLDMTYDTGSGGEYSKMIKFIEGALALPLGKYVDEKIEPQLMNTYLIEAKKKLDRAVYGHADCKDYILQIIAQYMSKGSSRGKVFGIQGPPGNGKTSLVRNGVCKVLNRPFAMIALGGISDGSLMEGHDFTYEGSMWGKLAQCLMDAKCMNPVIYFDELDKISQTNQGEEIVGILTHLVDFSQNDCIRDRYFNGIDLDYSRCVFVFSFNDESIINPVLRDRIQIFQTTGFTDEEKITIAKDYLLPDICKDYIFSADHIQISRETLHHILVKYVAPQDGVRDLKRKIELLILKMNFNMLIEGKTIDFENPFLITKEYADKALSITKQKEHTFSNIYM